jgi:ABC-type sugar transport system ATPase subunit
MDEPLAFLGDQMRTRLRTAIRRIHRERGMTSLLVTANQHDAMALSDRIGVLFNGVVHQIGTPDDLYWRPATASVARFFGEPAMNVLPAQVSRSGDRNGTKVEVLGRAVTLWTPLLADYVAKSVLVGIRPEDVVIGEPASRSIEGSVRATEPLGNTTLTELGTPDGSTLSCTLPGAAVPIGTVLDIGLKPDRLHLFDPGTELAILHPPSHR